MTTHDMTDEQLEVLIWNMLHPDAEATVESRATAIEICLWGGYYTTDLNACQCFETIIPYYKRALFTIILSGKTKTPDRFESIFATARQRCEAFVEVMEGR